MIRLFLTALFILSVCGCTVKYKITPVYKWEPHYLGGYVKTEEIDYYKIEPMKLRPPILSSGYNHIENRIQYIEYLEAKQKYVMIFHYLRQIKVHLDLWHTSSRASRKYILEYIDKINSPKETYVFRKEILENGAGKATMDTYKRMYRELGDKYQLFRFRNQGINKSMQQIRGDL